MDRSGSVAKNIVAAPTFDPVREVEYGCGRFSTCEEILETYGSPEHLQEFFSGKSETSQKLMNAFVNLQCSLAKPMETQTTRGPKDSKKTPLTILRPTYMCLQCANISNIDDRDAHCQATKHQLCKCLISMLTY